jgi:regulator of protease activity HflC (stomatin/prohibitin superfamily)
MPVTTNVSTSSGVPVDVRMTIVYSLDPTAAAHIYQTVGENYYDVLIAPYIERTAKNVFVNYAPEALYTTERAAVNTVIEDSLRAALAPAGIIIQQVPIDNIDLPQNLIEAIVEKQMAEQSALRMQYVLQQQTQEAERMRIEAQGIHDYQEIVSEGISDQLLVWKAIEVTSELANSPNTTFVILGNTDTGLPMILPMPE